MTSSGSNAASPHCAPGEYAERLVDFGAPYDLVRTLGVLQRGYGDPSFRIDPPASAAAHRGGPAGTPGAGAWMCFRVYGVNSPPGKSDAPRRASEALAGAETSKAALPILTGRAVSSDPLISFHGAAPSGALQELGAVTLRFEQVDAQRVNARILGTTRQAVEAARERAPRILGTEDDWSEFEFLLDALEDDASLALARIRRRHPGVRLPATGQLFDQLVTVTLEQKVTHEQARHSWRNLLRRRGERAPSAPSLVAPEWMRLPLNVGQLREVPSWEWHKIWVQPPLSATVQRLAGRSAALHRLAETPLGVEDLAELNQKLSSIPGVGAWTAAEALQRSHGAADLPAVGDWHLPHIVGEALTGRRTDDAGMLRALEPWRGHRHRVIRLIRLSGFEQQRYGPKLAPEDHRRR